MLAMPLMFYAIERHCYATILLIMALTPLILPRAMLCWRDTLRVVARHARYDYSAFRAAAARAARLPMPVDML